MFKKSNIYYYTRIIVPATMSYLPVYNFIPHYYKIT